MSIALPDFRFIAGLVRQRSAIDLQPGKEYLVEARLVPLLHPHGEPTLAALINRLRRGDRELSDAVIEALTTNETLWFRDSAPFEAFRKHLLPAVARTSTSRTITIWSAACSSGQEAYSLAMLLLDWLPHNPQYDARIIGTDVSHEMIERARAATYSQLEVNRGMRAPYLAKHFQKTGRTWTLSPEVRNLTTFTWANLADPPTTIPVCDIIFLRNVLIYFDPETKRRVIGYARSVLRPGGFLLLGGAESTPSLGAQFTRLDLERTVVFQHTDQQAAKSVSEGGS